MTPGSCDRQLDDVRVYQVLDKVPDHPLSLLIDVLLAVCRVDGGAVDEHGGVDAALAELEAPDLLAGSGLERVDAATAVAGDDQPAVVDDSHVGRRLRVLVRLRGRGR